METCLERRHRRIIVQSCPDPLQGVVFLWPGMNNMAEAVRDNPELIGTVHSLTQTF